MRSFLPSSCASFRYVSPRGRFLATIGASDIPPRTDHAAPAQPHELVQRVNHAFNKQIHLPAGSPLVVSVSGGADSVALFRILLALTSHWRWRLHVLHFNHGLRVESVEEEAFVQELAIQHDIPFHVRRLPPGWAGHNPTAVQERTRDWRRRESLQLLSELRREEVCASLDLTSVDGKWIAGAAAKASDAAGVDGVTEAAIEDVSMFGSIALGHHAGDQTETVLLKWMRGVHLSNLKGMMWQQGSSSG